MKSNLQELRDKYGRDSMAMITSYEVTKAIEKDVDAKFLETKKGIEKMKIKHDNVTIDYKVGKNDGIGVSLLMIDALKEELKKLLKGEGK